jgi:phospholipase/lecithinase/hemolysin
MATRVPALALSLLLAPVVVSAGPITATYVVGDSLSDSGNAFIGSAGTFPPPPYAMRASNGPVAVEYLAQALGLALSPALAGGTNYAVFGATTGTLNALLPSDTGMLSQAAFLAMSMPAIGPDDLFVVWGGPNDFLADQTTMTADDAVANLQTIIGGLYALGARNFLVPNMPDLSLTPFAAGLSPLQRFGLQQLTAYFNSGLSLMLNSLMLPGAGITPFDAFSLLHQIAAAPGAFGFTNATEACFNGVSVCAQPDQYLFWDNFHPTTAAHALIGSAFADAVAPVPEPATIALFGLGVAAVARRRRGRRERHQSVPEAR